jgi:hypothetical protein
MFSPDLQAVIIETAERHGIEPATLLAVVEIESGGRTFVEIAGRPMPLIRFEHHVFHRQLSPASRPRAIAEGLASPRWGQLKNPVTQRERYALLTRAMRIDREAAHAACSWGVGQVLGENARWLGYESAEAMAHVASKGLDGQIAVMLRFIQRRGLSEALRCHDWVRFAEGYNGPAQARHDYSGRLANAYVRWQGTDKPSDVPPMLAKGSRGETVVGLQSLLNACGFNLVADGIFGLGTSSAVRQFQAQQGLVRDGIAGPATWARLHIVAGKRATAA